LYKPITGENGRKGEKGGNGARLEGGPKARYRKIKDKLKLTGVNRVRGVEGVVLQLEGPAPTDRNKKAACRGEGRLWTNRCVFVFTPSEQQVTAGKKGKK